MSACAPDSPAAMAPERGPAAPKPAPEPGHTLAATAAPGWTVVCLGVPEAAVVAALRARLGSTGLLVLCSPAVTPPAAPAPAGDDGAPVAVIRSTLAATGVLSHAADLILILTDAIAIGATPLAEEARRLAAPLGTIAAHVPAARSAALTAALIDQGFRMSRRPAASGGVLLTGRGPR